MHHERVGLRPERGAIAARPGQPLARDLARDRALCCGRNGCSRGRPHQYGDPMELLVVLGIVTAVFLAWYGVRTYRPKPPPAALERPRPAALKGQGPRRVSAVDRASGAGSVEEMEAKQAYAKRGVEARKPVTEAWIDHALPEIDLRSLASRRLRIVGVANYLRDRERSLFGGVEYRLVREPENVYDANAVAVYGQERKVGYLSAA